jgi:hypothetical protein
MSTEPAMTSTPFPERVELVEAAMRSYAEAAMQHGWQSALGAANSGRLAMTWDTAWFERNPPITAMPEELIDRLINLDAIPTNFELSWGELDDPSECVWQVHSVNGGRNDREWTLLATAETPSEAIRLAMLNKGK